MTHGDADGTVDYELGQDLYDALPDPKGFLTLSGGGHYPLRERTVRKRLVGFFAACLRAPWAGKLLVSAADAERLREFETSAKVE